MVSFGVDFVAFQMFDRWRFKAQLTWLNEPAQHFTYFFFTYAF